MGAGSGPFGPPDEARNEVRPPSRSARRARPGGEPPARKTHGRGPKPKRLLAGIREKRRDIGTDGLAALKTERAPPAAPGGRGWPARVSPIPKAAPTARWRKA